MMNSVFLMFFFCQHNREITGALDLSSLPGVSRTGSPMHRTSDFSTSVSEEEPSENTFQKHRYGLV